MQYSIKPIIHHHEDKDKRYKVIIQVIYNRTKSFAPTIVKVSKEEWDGEKVINHKQKSSFNTAIKSVCSGIETRLLDHLKFDANLTKYQLDLIVKDKKETIRTNKVYDYILEVAQNEQGKLSDGRAKHYKVISNKVKGYDSKATLSDITLDWVEGFERYLRNGDKPNKFEAVGVNTLASNMSILIKVIHTAINKDLIQTNPIKNYKRPSTVNTTPIYLTESEIATFHDMVEKIAESRMKRSGYYYLLSCYTGYRISDAKTFTMDRFTDGKLVLRATKNKVIVSISVFPRLQKVLDYIQDKPLDIPEQEVRKHVKTIAGLCGIKKHLKYHSSRHSFAMLLMANGFTTDEVAEFLGDSKDIAKVYARIDNGILNRKIMNALA